MAKELSSSFKMPQFTEYKLELDQLFGLQVQEQSEARMLLARQLHWRMCMASGSADWQRELPEFAAALSPLAAHPNFPHAPGMLILSKKERNE